MEHSRVAMGRIIPGVGDTLVTNRRRPILTLIEDTSGGIHDTLMAACDRYRYELLGCTGIPRQLHRQPRRRAARTRPRRRRRRRPAQPVHEHPGPSTATASNSAAGQHARQLCHVARRDGLRRRLLGLPAGHPADQRRWRAADRGAFRDCRLRVWRAPGRSSGEASLYQYGLKTTNERDSARPNDQFEPNSTIPSQTCGLPLTAQRVNPDPDRGARFLVYTGPCLCLRGQFAVPRASVTADRRSCAA